MRVQPLACSILVLLLVTALPSSAEEDPPPKLIGEIGVDDLKAEPFDAWFDAGYDDYVPNEPVLRSLREIDRSGVELQVFFGTWCGDSRREVPRMVRLFDAVGVDRSRVHLVGLDNEEGLLKRSPGGEEVGLEIYRVPTLIVKRGGREVARLVEHPVLSLERDLLAMLRGDRYAANYASYPILRGWLASGLLSDANASARGLAGLLQHLVTGPGELAAAGRVMIDRGQIREGATVHEINAALHRDDAASQARLAEARLLLGDAEGARDALERALRHNDDPERLESLIELAGRIERARDEETAD